jgi:two-component system response regulator AtoC
MEHSWPGNVRELRNAIERAMVLEESAWLGPASLTLEPADHAQHGQPAVASAIGAPGFHGTSLVEAEKAMVLDALQKAGWNQTRAAEFLSITRDTLRYKMKKFNLRSTEAGAGEK